VSPANSVGALVVGASTVAAEKLADGSTKTIDKRAPNTAFGPCIDIYAPGDSVMLPSLDRNNAPVTQLWNGTSMAAGYVSGALALYLETHPKATPDQSVRAIEQSATPNVVQDTKAPASRMLYVGAVEQRVVASRNPTRQ
jgi:subtilisin family serine protease